MVMPKEIEDSMKLLTGKKKCNPKLKAIFDQTEKFAVAKNPKALENMILNCDINPCAMEQVLVLYEAFGPTCGPSTFKLFGKDYTMKQTKGIFSELCDRLGEYYKEECL